MIKNFVISLKYLCIVLGLLLAILSCEKDFKNIGVNIVDNNVFSTGKYTSEIKAYSRNIEKNHSNNLNYYLLGLIEDSDFGKLEASIVTQLSLGKVNPDYGVNAVIEKVVLDIPYYSSVDGKHGNGSPKFKIDSLWTSELGNFQLDIFELGTFLNMYDPNDPSQLKKYYSNDVFDKITPPLFSGVITPDPNDTILIVERYKYPDFPDLSTGELYKKDTIKKTGETPHPSLKIPFDKNNIAPIFQQGVLDHPEAFASSANFQHYFRGFYFEASQVAANSGALLALKFSDAVMTIYFSETQEKNEEDDEDLNDNGIMGEQGVIIGVPRSFTFPLTGIISNLFSRDYTGTTVENYLTNPDETNGEELLFVQGAAGSHAIFKLFGEDTDNNNIPDDLDYLRQQKWLINDAQLTFYINNTTSEELPDRLYLYQIEEEGNFQPYDVRKQKGKSIGGTLEKDSDEKPIKYTFRITDFISEIIQPDTKLDLPEFGLKIYDSFDSPSSTNANDTIMREYDSNHKGVILKGNLPISDENRLKLDIYYTQKND